jgi:hypothetical protein
VGQKILVTLTVTMPEREPKLRHNLSVELDLDYDKGIITGFIPAESSRNGAPEAIQKHITGESNLGAVLGWLTHMNKNPRYISDYAKKQAEMQKK